jgi:hypothetical protein
MGIVGSWGGLIFTQTIEFGFFGFLDVESGFSGTFPVFLHQAR